jgi:radical SAM protein with 4Fe4S-binding SPASM domain
MTHKNPNHGVGESPKLTHIDLEITRECNLKCVHCSAESKNRGKEMSMDAIKKMLQEAKSIGLEKVGLTGGEPFLRKEKLLEIGNFCKTKLKIPIHIHSNGTEISKSDAAWVKQIDAEITIPFYGNNATVHDSITDKKGSFSSTLNGLKNLISANADVCVYIVPMKQNLKAIKPLIQMVYDEGVRKVRVLSLSPTGRAKTQFEKLELDESDTTLLNNELIEISKKLKKMELSTGFCTSQNLKGLNLLKGHEQCFAAENRIHIDTFGNVFPCTASSGRLIFSAGNVQMPENNLSSIWKESPLLQFFRRFHANPPQKCVKCKRHSSCMSGCRIKMSYKYGDVTIPEPNCKGPYN